ncbi:MAG: ubiquinol-cytochrome c reductase iron-sulfur subunit [Pseudomonadota bacterium]
MSTAEDHQDPERRDFLYYATAGAGAVTVGAAVWPLVNQMNPSADVRALSELRTDIEMEPGEQIRVLWQGKPVFIRRRTEEEVASARDVDVETLPDTNARNGNDGEALASDENRSFGENDEYVLFMGVCTHLGCVPVGAGEGDYGGWFCPCHGSHYDLAGRIRRGPAPQNLHIPEFTYEDGVVVLLKQYRA